MSDSTDSDDADVEPLLEEIIAALDRDPHCDVEVVLRAHPALADRARARLARLRGSGLLPGATEFVGRTIAGRYRVLGELGRGGMGVVLRAEDVALGRQVALKLISRTDAARSELLVRFHREARIHGRLEHPGIVAVHDAGETESDGAYFAMRLVEGRTLREVIEAMNRGDPDTEREMTLRRQVDVVLRICDALSFAHERGVVHRDLKPANVMIGRFGEVHLMDWGLAKELGATVGAEKDLPQPPSDARSSPEHTVDGYLFGTPSYMAPEQALGEAARVDARTDVFGVGAILYHLLSGNPPYWGRTMTEVVTRASRGALNDPGMKRARRRVPRELERACRTALAKSREERYASVRDFAADLVAFLELRPGRAWRDTPSARLVKLVRRRPVAATSVFALGLIGTAVTIALTQTRVARAEQSKRLAIESAQSAALIEAVRRDQLEGLAVTLDQIRRDAPRTAKPGALEDRDVLIARYEHTFREHALGLDGRLSVGELAAEIGDERRVGSATRDGILDGLYQTEIALYMQDYAWAAEFDAGRQQKFPSNITTEYLRELTISAPDRLRLWLRARELVDLAETDSATADVWRTFLDWVGTGRKTTRELLEQMLETQASDRALTLGARICERMYSDVEAVPIWKKIAARRPDVFDVNAYLLYAAARRAFPAEDGILHGRAAMALSPDAPWIWVALADCYGQTGELDRAVEHARIAISLAPREAAAHEVLGWVLQLRADEAIQNDGPEAGVADLEAAADSLRASIARRPESPNAYQMLARVEELRGRPSSVLQAFDEAARAALPDKRDLVLIQKAAFAGRIGLLDESWRFCQEFSEGSAARAVSFCQFSAALLERGQLEHATEILRRGVEMRVSLTEPWPWMEPEPELRDTERRLRLVTGAEEPGTINELNGTAQRAEKREEYLRAFEIWEALVARLEQIADKEKWIEETGGAHPANTYRFAARAAARVSAGMGYVHTPLTRIRWHPEWPFVEEVPGVGATPVLNAAERPSLADWPGFDEALRNRARERATACLAKTMTLLLGDVSGSAPFFDDPDLRREIARELVDDPALAPFLDTPLQGNARSILTTMADR